MLINKQLVIASLSFTIIMTTAPVYAQSLATKEILWPDNSISMEELQGLLNKNNGYNNLHIVFLNRSSWDINANQASSIHQSYLEQAKDLGFSDSEKLPQLVFSAMQKVGLNSNDIVIPNMNGSQNLSNQMSETLRNARYKELNLDDSLPDWFKDMIVSIYAGILKIAAYIHSEFFK